MDKIILDGLDFFGYHGALREENSLGQRFIVDIELYLPLGDAGLSDDLNKTVHYGEVYNLVKDIVENRVYKLIETVAENISIEILKKFTLVEGLKIRIRKPQAPVPGIFNYLGVEITRSRDE